MYGRPPNSSDFIVPRLRADLEPLSYNIAGKAHRRAELAAGVEHVHRGSTHRFRKAAASIACNSEHGVPAELAAIRALTHTGRDRDVFSRYRQFTWPTLCAAVRCLELELPALAQVISLGGRRVP